MVGTLKTGPGMVYKTDNVKIVRHNKKKGDDIAKHNHPNADIYFTLIEGSIEVYFNDDEKHVPNIGDVIHFNGENYINVKILEDSKIQVTIVPN